MAMPGTPMWVLFPLGGAIGMQKKGVPNLPPRKIGGQTIPVLNLVLGPCLFGSRPVLYRLTKSLHRSGEFCYELFAVMN